ncbi:MAG: starch synthase, partial [Elusimicrobiota bacterium]|nr:starch synthase [Elusimicrobiota bacterium]
ALTYGAIPIVNRTGGLSDTIQSFNSETGEGNGFVFNITYGENFVETILKSAQVFNDRHQWVQLMTNAFNSKFTWDDSVEYYQEMYQYLISKKEYETVYR